MDRFCFFFCCHVRIVEGVRRVNKKKIKSSQSNNSYYFGGQLRISFGSKERLKKSSGWRSGFFFLCFCCTGSMQKFPGQGSSPNHSSDNCQVLNPLSHWKELLKICMRATCIWEFLAQPVQQDAFPFLLVAESGRSTLCRCHIDCSGRRGTSTTESRAETLSKRIKGILHSDEDSLSHQGALKSAGCRLYNTFHHYPHSYWILLP